jgi:hypothetical protein
MEFIMDVVFTTKKREMRSFSVTNPSQKLEEKSKFSNSRVFKGYMVFGQFHIK